MNDRLQARVTGQWQASHRAHLTPEAPTFTTKPFEHPSGAWVWLVCPCGAKHLTTEPDLPPAPTVMVTKEA